MLTTRYGAHCCLVLTFLFLDLRSTKVAKAVYQHYDLSGYGEADMAIGCRYYSLPSQRVKQKKGAGIVDSWAWADIYEGGGTVS